MSVKELKKENFEERINSKTAIIDFSASWCHPCKLLNPAFESLSNEIKADFFKVDVDEEQELAQKFSILSVPTIVIIKNGKETSRLTGFQGKEWLKRKLIGEIK